MHFHSERGLAGLKPTGAGLFPPPRSLQRPAVAALSAGGWLCSGDRAVALETRLCRSGHLPELPSSCLWDAVVTGASAARCLKLRDVHKTCLRLFSFRCFLVDCSDPRRTRSLESNCVEAFSCCAICVLTPRVTVNTRVSRILSGLAFWLSVTSSVDCFPWKQTQGTIHSLTPAPKKPAA